jgi:hypothetical protein
MIIQEGNGFGLLIFLLAFAISYYFFKQAEAGKAREIRKVAGLEALDESINRSVEMGRPVLASTSYDSLASAQTLAQISGISLIRHAAVQTAKLGTPLLLPIGAADVLALVDQNYKEACIEAGAPEAYNPENVQYLTQEQWAYTTGVLETMETRKPGSCIFISRFHAEALHLGVAAKRIGSLMIGGTPHWGMSAFFAVTADYTLLGDEIYAAAAYVSKDPKMTSFLTAQDLLKYFSVFLLLIGSVLVTFGSNLIINILNY